MKNALAPQRPAVDIAVPPVKVAKVRELAVAADTQAAPVPKLRPRRRERGYKAVAAPRLPANRRFAFWN
jgi:hypothetical protein